MLGISAALGVWLLHLAGGLAAWDGVLYDRVLSLTSRWRDPEPKVLLLRLTHAETWSDADAIKTLSILNELGARAIVFDFLPCQNSREFYQRAADLQKVVVGRGLIPDPNNPDQLELETWPAVAGGLELPWGVVYVPPSLNGVYRQQWANVNVGADTIPTLEGKVATYCRPAASKATTGSFLVNFAGGPGSLPNVPLSKVLAGDLIPQMVEGKVVLAGSRDGWLGMETPVSGGNNPMTFLEFQGNALQTLLDEAPIRPLASFWLLIWLVGLGFASALLYQRVTSVAGARLVLGLLLFCACVAVAGMWFYRLWLPLGPVVLTLTGQYALTLVFRARMTNRALNEMRLHALNQVKERHCAPDVLLLSEYWEHLASMVTQTLEVGRMVFLERVPRTQRLRGIKAVQCGFEDLLEKERNLEAAVYRQALGKGSPVRVNGMFKDAPRPEVEYLCPLVFAGEVMGMWLIGIDTDKAASIPQLEGVLAKFSQQVARLLYYKQQATPNPSWPARLRFWLSREREAQAYSELKRTSETLERHDRMLEAVLSEIGTAIIVYDFFGRVLKANEPAMALLRAEDFALSRKTAFDFLRLVTGQDEAHVCRLLRNVLLEGVSASLSVRLASQGERQYLLRLFPLSGANPPLPAGESPEVHGLVCELIETTSLSTLASLKGVVADRLGVELRDHLAAIEMSAALLEMDGLSFEERRSVLEAIHGKTRTCVEVINECQKYLGRGVDAHTLDCFPLDALEVLSQVCSAFAPRLTQRQITLRIEQPRLMDQVLASTSNLTRLFVTSLELLLKDAAETSALTIKVEEISGMSVFRLSNCGFGIPNERLQQALTGPEPPASEEFRLLREAMVWVSNWGGSLEVTSDVGRGYDVVLRLQQFKLTSLLPSQTGQA